MSEYISMTAVSDHFPVRPQWSCHGCSDPWPCPSAQRRLLAAHLDTPALLMSTLRTQHFLATYDLPDWPAGQLRARIVDWADPVEHLKQATATANLPSDATELLPPRPRHRADEEEQ